MIAREGIIRKIKALSNKTKSAGCTPDEIKSSKNKILELRKLYNITDFDLGFTSVIVVPQPPHVHEYSCNTCKKKFVTEDDFKKHKHPKKRTGVTLGKFEEKYICTICNKNFKSKLSLAGHMRMHPITEREKIKIDNPVFKCDICKKEFKTSNELSGHTLGAHYFKKEIFKCKLKFKSYQEMYMYYLENRDKMSSNHIDAFNKYILNKENYTVTDFTIKWRKL